MKIAKTVVLWSFICTVAFIAGCLLYQARDSFAHDPVILTSGQTSSANSSMLWSTTASSIAELTAKADLIVRTRVTDAPEPRLETFVGPIWSKDGEIVGQTEVRMIFSDTQMEVLEVYEGESVDVITVMQTGGSQPMQTIDNSPVQRLSVKDDPLYVVGEESVLFLVDISDDPIHAQGRTLYRTINPAGRYAVQGIEVHDHSESPVTGSCPQILEELISQIRQASSELLIR